MLRMRKWMLAPVVLILLAPASRQAIAQEPVVVIATKSVDGLIGDMKFVLNASGQPQLGDIIDGMIDQATQGKGLQGINRTKPAGAYMSISSAGTPDLVVFVPVDDIKAFRDLIATFLPQQQNVAGGMFSIQGEGQQFYGKFQNGYCFLSLLPTALSKLPDPSKFGKTKYALGIEADLAKLPDEVKEQLLEQLEEGVAAAPLDAAKPANDIQARLQERAQKMMLEMIRMLVKDADKLTMGLDVDQKSKVMAIDLAVTAKPGTQLAQAVANYAKTTSAFSSVAGSDAAASLNFAVPVADALRELWRDAFKATLDEARANIDKPEKGRTDQQKQLAKDLMERVLEIAQATGDTGKLDGVLVLNTGGDGKAQLVAAGTVVKGNELAKVIDDSAKQNPTDSGLKKLKLDVAKHGGARIHAIEVELEADAKEQFGGGPAHLAIRDDAVYFALGGDSLAAIKIAIDRTGKPDSKRPPVSVRVQPSKLIAIFGKGDDPMLKLAREAFTGDGDSISLELLPIDRGARLRLEFGEGFIRFLGKALGEQLGG